MTRIVAGFAGSLSLEVPRQGTRPTSDRVREAIFSALEARDAIDGARVLDLYAGSGALGLEAASRGAAEVVLVERAKGAADVARRNAARVTAAAPAGFRPTVRIVAQPVRSYLEQASGAFDLVFTDPPYELSSDEMSADLAALAPLLAPDATVVVERSARDPEPVWPAGLELVKRSDYGETVVFRLVAE